MRVLCTFPGRAGDILWALPTVRAIAEASGVPVDFRVAGEFAGMVPLLRQQEYLGSVRAILDWGLTPPNEWEAPVGRLGDYDKVYNLGYRQWPTTALPYFVAQQAGVTIDLERPWIRVERDTLFKSTRLVVGFTEAWFELKLGLTEIVTSQPPIGTRWTTEGASLPVLPCGWVEAAQRIEGADLFFGDCSALHVLAVALGKKVVLMEPMEARWNPIFYPFGMDGRVQVVKGNDDNPTFDARHCAGVLREALTVRTVRTQSTQDSSEEPRG